MTKEEASEFMTNLTVYINMLILEKTSERDDKEQREMLRIVRRRRKSELIKLLVAEEDE